MQQRPALLEPLPAPANLPPLPQAASAAAGSTSSSEGPLGISPAELRRLAAEAYSATLHPQLLPTAAGTLGLSGAAAGSLSSFSEEESGSALIDRLAVPAGSGPAAAAPGGRGWEAELAAEFAAGEGPVLQALGSYFRHMETSVDPAGVGGSDAERAALAGAIAAFDTPPTPDGCFPALFGRCAVVRRGSQPSRRAGRRGRRSCSARLAPPHAPQGAGAGRAVQAAAAR